MDRDWRFTMTATGEIGAKYEVVIATTTSEEQEKSYNSYHTFSLYAETVTVTREELIVEGYEPPVDIEFKVFFDLPMNWTLTIEE